jgi:hypothetical protein
MLRILWLLVLAFPFAGSRALSEDLPLPSSAAIANYPLHADGVDATGNNDPMVMVNVAFTHNAAECSGVFAGDPGGYLLSTPHLTALDFGSFAVSARFMISAWPSAGEVRFPIVVCGDDTRYFGAEVYSDGALGLLYNNSNHAKSSTPVIKFAWHTLVMTYEAESGVGRIYLDGSLAASQYFVLQQSGDRNLSTANFGEGTAFAGLICEIVVYDSAFDPLPVAQTTWGGIKSRFRATSLPR